MLKRACANADYHTQRMDVDEDSEKIVERLLAGYVSIGVFKKRLCVYAISTNIS